MDNEIISYLEMCQREGASLQKGMNFLAERPHSVVLMSVRRDAPYGDRIEDEGRTLIYEGHNSPRNLVDGDPAEVDQPERTSRGTPTENGRFAQAASEHKTAGAAPRVVRAYEKLHKGIWSYNGSYLLTDTWQESDGTRSVFKFRLELQDDPSSSGTIHEPAFQHSRIIPTPIKLEVWKRDKGQCVKCGERDGLHFDHVLAYSRGGSSVTSKNIQLLCARHNLEKGTRFE